MVAPQWKLSRVFRVQSRSGRNYSHPENVLKTTVKPYDPLKIYITKVAFFIASNVAIFR